RRRDCQAPYRIDSAMTLIEHLRQLADEQLIRAVTGESFAFRHALTREAVYGTLLKRQRSVYHDLVGQALEQLYAAQAPGSAARRAYTVREGVKRPKALRCARVAGEQAQQQCAPHEAAQHFSHALEAAQQRGQPAELALLRGRGQAYDTLGDFERARADY